MTVVASAKARLLGTGNVLDALLPGVTVSYSMPPTVPEQFVCGGSVAGTVELKAMAGGARVKRSEELSFPLLVRVRTKGAKTTETAEARAAEIGDVIALYIAANWTLGDVADLKKAEVSALNLDGWVDDDGAGATLTLTVGLTSYLT